MRFKNFLSLMMVITLLFISACIPMKPEGPEGLAKDARLFLKAEKLFKFKSYKKALTLYNEYMSKYPSGPSAPDVLMREGEIYKVWRDNKTARKVYLYLIDKYRGSPHASNAMIEVLMTLYNEGAYKQLISQADQFLKSSTSRSSEIYFILGNSYMATHSPVNAAYFYAKANEDPAGIEHKNNLSRLKQAIKALNTEDIISLLERVKDQDARGYLLYRLGLVNMDEGNYEDGMRTLSQFVDMFPKHEYQPHAEQLLKEAQERVQDIGYGSHSIGCLLPLTGSHKIYGNKALRGIELALDYSGARDSVRLIVQDTGSNPEQAVNALEQLAYENVSAIIGPIITAESAAYAAQRAGIPIIALSHKDRITEIGDYVFRNFLTPQMQVKAVVSYAVETLGLYNFAVLYPDEKYGTTFMNLFWNEVSSYGGNVTASESYGVKDTDFRRPIRKIRQSDFDAIFIPDAASKAGLIIPQLRFYDVKKVPLLGTNLWHSDKLISMARKFIQGAVVPDVFFAGSSYDKVQNFIENFKTNFGEKPGFIEALSYDTAMILLEVFKQPGVRSPSAVKDALFNVYDFQGITGKTGFKETGEADKSLYLLEVKGSKFVEIEERY